MLLAGLLCLWTAEAEKYDLITIYKTQLPDLGIFYSKQHGLITKLIEKHRNKRLCNCGDYNIEI